MAGKQFLDTVYGQTGVQQMKDIYRDWAASYDAELASNGYVTPARAAAALGRFTGPDAAVFDVGCGTGLYGAALAQAGFTAIDGCDTSPEMLEKAGEKGVYRNLVLSAPDHPPDFSGGPYPVVSAIGVIGAGAAPITLYHEIVGGMAPGGLFVFTFNDHTLREPAFGAAVAASVAGGHFEELFKEYGPHLPKRDMKSIVYILKKL
ncbi:MAG: methyltransferase domain-containing protein [Rhodobacteraceae bacterium]|nr:methyltransferase domain-containing protein [Paracoccaceae bacterium]